MFTTSTKVRFAHVDPAGIVFYPRYFEMLNGAVEDWFEDAVGQSFASLHLGRKVGTPTVHLEVDFQAPSRLGDVLEIAIVPLTLGESSCRLAVTFSCAGAARLRVELVLVCMDLASHRAMPWPEDLRAAIAPQVVAA
ncbi:acyl-CoA thioesterase [Novosphingobium profundi]|uniref:acyl-CoA thioesterase n=1 Tax=Novosphingobium profundi TaxID=1774954 RepID=UPI001BDA81EA|nr:thioesterase family protein [Novosphingobium profundi]MBT0670754.1 acyl-CoA thioesterase [Novosphingobium profundi]